MQHGDPIFYPATLFGKEYKIKKITRKNSPAGNHRRAPGKWFYNQTVHNENN